jgi:hypothetical protein
MKKIRQRGLPVWAGRKRINKARKINKAAQICRSPVILCKNFMHLGKFRVVLFFSEGGINPGLFQLLIFK